MTENFVGVREKIASAVDGDALRQIEGWNNFDDIFERVNLHQVEVRSIEGTDHKWIARAIVVLHMFNWDDERCGELRLHMLSSGHSSGSEICIDSLLISPNLH